MEDIKSELVYYCKSSSAKPSPDYSDAVKKPYEANAYEVKMLENTKSATQLLEEERIKKMYDEEEAIKIKRKQYITKVKVIALNRLHHPALSNPSNFTQKEKMKVIDMMRSILDTETEDSITKEFNDVCEDKIFNPKMDYSTYPCYDF
jgi:hypothetical protein